MPPAAAAAPAVHPRPRRAPAPRAPRRVSGPARPTRATPPRSDLRQARRPLPLLALALFGALAQHRLLDRLIRGRTWIGLVAFALIGIVTLQLGLLKLNGGIGRALERAELLQRQNATLSIENSEMASSLKVEKRAPQLGMAFATTGELRFLDSHANEDPAKAAAVLASDARTASAAQASGSSGEASEASASQAGSTAVSAAEAASPASAPSVTGASEPSPTEAHTSEAATSTAATAEPSEREPARSPSASGASVVGAAEAQTASGG
jgi:hypothetical protein